MRYISFALAIVAVALTTSACTTTYVADDSDIAPGYTPTWSEKISHLAIFNDMDDEKKAGTFVTQVCAGMVEKPAEKNKQTTPTTTQATTTATASTDSKSKLHLELKPDDKTTFTADKDADPKIASGKDLKVTVAQTTTTTSTKGASGSSNDTAKSGETISTCAYRVISAAVNVCVRRTGSRNILNKIENVGIAQIVALSAATAGVATLAGASGKTTTLLTTGVGVASTLASGMQTSIGDTQKPAVNDIITVGKAYAALGDNDPQDLETLTTIGKTEDDNAIKLRRRKIRLLFDTAFSVCPVIG
jgi:hypothetical protein